MTSLCDCMLIEQFKQGLRSKGYTFFERGDLNLNIIGVRGPNRTAGLFDDTLIVIYKEAGQWQLKWFWITTDAGTYWLANPMKYNGTALLKEGQYRSSWVIGKHKGEYSALVQAKPVEVYRDNNKDQILDFDSASVERGFFGINIHRSSPNRRSYENDRYSAGCQVFSDPEDYEFFMGLVHRSSIKYGPHFTYTLMNEGDFVEGNWRTA